jgi:hypothetical protein
MQKIYKREGYNSQPTTYITRFLSRMFQNWLENLGPVGKQKISTLSISEKN